MIPKPHHSRLIEQHPHHALVLSVEHEFAAVSLENEVDRPELRGPLQAVDPVAQELMSDVQLQTDHERAELDEERFCPLEHPVLAAVLDVDYKVDVGQVVQLTSGEGPFDPHRVDRRVDLEPPMQTFHDLLAREPLFHRGSS
jgi:hypothetical protein